LTAYNTLLDDELVSQLKQGDQQAYTEIYARYHAGIYIHIFNRLRIREDSKDLVHDLFSSLWHKREELNLHTSLKAYLYSAARYKVFDWLSRREVQSQYVSSISNFIAAGECVTDHRVRERQLMELVELEIAALPPKMREIFALSRQGYFSHKEIAGKLDISEKTVKKQINNSLKILRAKLGTTIFTAFFL
jgi:RNA polymerase sigma-70 factor (ECF subfamily)